MKRILIILISFTVLTVGFTLKINAQIESSNITISPAASYIKPGERFTLIIENNTATDLAFDLKPILLNFNLSGRNLTPIDDPSLSPETMFEYPPFNPIISPKSSLEIEVKYLGKSSNLVPGLAVVPDRYDSEDSRVLGAMVSTVVDMSLSEEEKSDINVDLEIMPATSFLGFSLGSEYEIKSEIKNDTQNLIKIQSEILVKADETYLESFPLSDQLMDSFLPSDSKQFSKIFLDERPWTERIGSINFVQEFKINGDKIIINQSIFSLPIEFLILVGAFIFILISFIVIRGVRKSSKKENDLTNGQRISENIINPNVEEKDIIKLQEQGTDKL